MSNEASLITTYTDIDYWKGRWEQNDIGFHKSNNHPMLVKYIDRLTENKADQKIFFPLCGKAVDIAWLASLGHQVIGVEVVRDACEQFYQEHGLKYSKSLVGDFELYKSEDGKIRIYNGDFFKFNKELEGEIENVWDRGSLVALPKDLRQQYAAHIQSLLAPRFKYLLDTYDYDQSLYPGPPHSVSGDEIDRLYQTKCKIEVLEAVPHPSFNGIDCTQIVRLLCPN